MKKILYFIPNIIISIISLIILILYLLNKNLSAVLPEVFIFISFITSTIFGLLLSKKDINIKYKNLIISVNIILLIIGIAITTILNANKNIISRDCFNLIYYPILFTSFPYVYAVLFSKK